MCPATQPARALVRRVVQGTDARPKRFLVSSASPARRRAALWGCALQPPVCSRSPGCSRRFLLPVPGELGAGLGAVSLHGAGDALPESGLVWGRNRSAVSAAEPFWRVVCGSDPATEQSRSARGGAVLPSTLDHVWVGSAAEGLRDTRLLMVKRRDDGEKGGLPGCSPHSFQVKDGSPDPGHCQAVAHCAVFVSLRCPEDLFVALGDAHLDFLGGQVQLLLL